MNSTANSDPVCTPDDEISQGAFWVAVTATTTSFTINNQAAYTGAGITPASPENIKDYVVYSGSCGNLTQIACATLDASATPSGQLTVSTVVAGQIYYIMASPSAGAVSSDLLRFCITAPVPYTVPNNSCATATSLDLDAPVRGTTAGACHDGPICSGSIENNIWYQWCAPASLVPGTEVFLNVFGGDPDSGPMCVSGVKGLQFTVWNTNTTCPTNHYAPFVLCRQYNQDSCFSGPDMSFIAMPGSCYFITIDGWAGASCAFNVLLTTSTASGGSGPVCSLPCQPPVITGQASICQGDSLVLSASVVQSSAVYSWSGPNNFNASTATIAIPNATGGLNGLYTVTVTDSMCSNTLTSTVLVNVNALPAQPTAQAVTGCGLSAATISASGTAQSFIWSDNSSGLPVLGTDSAYTAHNLQPGTTYTFYVQAVNAGCPPSAAVAVPVTALSVPSVASWPPLASICSGETVQLSAAGANSYQWIPAASIIPPTGAAVVASPVTSTTYTIIGTATNGCSDSAFQHVQVLSVPSAGFTFSQALNEFSFSATEPLAVYNWDFGDGNSSSLQNPVHTYATSGNFTVSLTTTNANSCSATSAQQVTSVISGRADAVNNPVSLYPNPAASYLYVASETDFRLLQIELFTLTGQKVLETKPAKANSPIDISGLSAGVYFARLVTDTFTYQQKILIRR